MTDPGPNNPPANAVTGSATDGPTNIHIVVDVGSGPTISASQISDATEVGLDLLTAADAPAARTVIGAEVVGSAATALQDAKDYADSISAGGGGGPITASLITDSTTVGRAVITAADQAAARTAIGAGTSSFDGTYGSLSGTPSTFTPTDASVTNAKVSATAAISADKLTDGTSNKILTSTERTKLAGVAAGATANSSDATLLARANHTGTQSADTVVDGTTNKAYTGAEKTKLAGVATGATANSPDSFLVDRANHTGSQSSSTISDFTEAVQDAVGAFLSGTSGVTVAYDDAANSLTITGSGAAGLDVEAVRDAIGVALVGVGLISVTVNDAADTITIATTATANDTDANLRNRATHTGTQSADTITDGTTNKAYTATEKTKLAGVATGATANDTDANLKNRANHTGTQLASTISDFASAADARVAAASLSTFSGTLGLAQLVPGGSFYIQKNGVNWEYPRGTVVTTRPSSRTDIKMISVSTDGSVPSFAITDWDEAETVPS